MTLDDRVEALDREVTKLKERMIKINEILNEATMTGRNAYAVYGRLQNYDQMFADFNSTLGIITKSIKIFMVDDKFIEEFTDYEIKNWYTQSAMTSKEIIAKIKLNFPGTDWDIDQVNNCLSGRTKDLKLRSFIGKILRESANKSKKA